MKNRQNSPLLAVILISIMGLSCSALLAAPPTPPTVDVNVINDEFNSVPVTVTPAVREHYFKSAIFSIAAASQNKIVLFTLPTDRILVVESVSINVEQEPGSLPVQYKLQVPTGSASCAVPLNFPTAGGVVQVSSHVAWQASQNLHAIADPDSVFTNLEVNYGRLSAAQSAKGIIAIMGHTLPLGSVNFASNCIE